MHRQRIAVIGGGVAGITAAHVLSRAHDVTLFESSASLGGHAHSVLVDDGGPEPLRLDTAFLVYNDLHYPSFVKLIEDLGVRKQTHSAEMSAAFVDDDKGLSYALLRGWDALFYQRKNLVSPTFYRLFAEALLLRRRADRDLREERIGADTTLAQYLAAYSDVLRENFVVPLASAIWSLPAAHVLAYPAKSILSFFQNHRLLSGSSGDAWRSFTGSSYSYVNAFAKRFVGTLCTGERVLSVRRERNTARVVTAVGARSFDRVVLATHADVSLRLLEDPSPEERAVLGAFRYHENRVTLHTDARLLHPDRRQWASWNIVKRRGDTRITYHLNRVQRLAARRDYFLTLGNIDMDPNLVTGSYRYWHPIFDSTAVKMQPAIGSLNRRGGTLYCGSYCGYGFHEDAVRSAVDVTRHFGLDLDSPRSSDAVPTSSVRAASSDLARVQEAAS